MPRDVFVQLDGPRTLWMRVEVGGHGSIPEGTRARARHLLPYGRPRLADPKRWIDLEIVAVRPKAIGNATLYVARSVPSVPAPAPAPATQGRLFP